MSLTAIVIMLAIGLVLIIFEFLVLPGTNISGIIGILLILTGIYFGYKYLGAMYGHAVLVTTLVVMVVTMIFILRSGTWQKISLKTSIDSKVENLDTKSITEGDKGKSLTRLAPIGTVLVNDKTFEGKSGHKFIDPGTPIEVVKIEGNQLIVKPTK